MGRHDGEYLADACNNTEHANRLVETARVAFENDNREAALKWLREAAKPADSATFAIRWAIEKLEKP